MTAKRKLHNDMDGPISRFFTKKQHVNVSGLAGSATHRSLASLWRDLCDVQLPAAAKLRSPCQPSWPVSLDHCFARIILDNAIGVDKPWIEVVKSPAIKNMTDAQFEAAIAMAEDVLGGKVNLAQLNDRSLRLREKREPLDVQHAVVANVFSTGIAQQSPTAAAPPSSSAVDYVSIISVSPDLSDFRKSVLSLICQIPPGRFTTYKHMSAHLSSSPRAVGNALRRNPYAPGVPCHRVLAADGSIGGFGGEWGEDGKHAREKRRLLSEEGVRFDVKGRAVGRPFDAFKNKVKR